MGGSMADLLERLRDTHGELVRLPPDRFDARRFRTAGLVSHWHEARLGPALAGRHRGRLWAVAEAGLDQVIQRAPRHRVPSRRFFGLLVAVELVGEGWPALVVLRRRGVVVSALRRLSPPAPGLGRTDLGPAPFAAGREAWSDGSPAAGALLREGAAGLLGRVAAAIGEPAPFGLTGTELLVALPRWRRRLRLEAGGDEAGIAIAADSLRRELDLPLRLVDLLEAAGPGPGRG